MRRLRLYQDGEHTPLAGTPVGSRKPDCRDCHLGGGPCTAVEADGGAGGLLVLGASPTAADKPWGWRPFSGKVGVAFRSEVARLWSGPVAWDYAIRCASVSDEEEEEEAVIAACRKYTAEIIQDSNPSRILVVAPQAARSLAGISYQGDTSRGSFAWVPRIRDGEADLDDLIPAFFLMSPGFAGTNHHLQRWLREDLEWALTVDVATLPRPQWSNDYVRVEDPSEVQDVLDCLSDHGSLAHDVETFGRMRDPDFRVFCLAISTVEATPRTFVFTDELLGDPSVREMLRAFYSQKHLVITGHNNKYDASSMCEMLGMGRIAGVLKDTSLQAKVIDVVRLGRLDVVSTQVGMGGHKDVVKQYVKEAAGLLSATRKDIRRKLGLDPDVPLDQHSREEVRREAEKHARWSWRIGNKLGEQMSSSHPTREQAVIDWATATASDHDLLAYAYALAPREAVERYCARDSVASALLEIRQSAEIEAVPERSLTWNKLVCPTTHAISRMERWGIPVDRDAMDAFSSMLLVSSTEAAKELANYGVENPGSRDQIADLLFKRLRLPCGARTATGKQSVADEVLEALEGKHPIVEVIRKYRQVEKLQGTYAIGLREHIRSDGRIHPSFRIAGTETGRMSCADPNMQTIPSRGDFAKIAKSIFAAPRGRKLVQFDYNQQELRIAAELSGDKEMISIFDKGLDYHSETAKIIAPMVWGVQFWKPKDEDWVKRPKDSQLMADIRRAAKVVNFGLLFGMGDAGLARDAHCSIDVARKTREVILGKFKDLDRWIKDQVTWARRNGYTRTFWDGQPARRRNIWRVSSKKDEERVHAEHASWNTPVQGSAHDYCLVSLCRSVDMIEAVDREIYLDLQVHDSLLFECWEDDVDWLIREVKYIMTDYDTRVPLVVDYKAGNNWGELS